MKSGRSGRSLGMGLVLVGWILVTALGPSLVNAGPTDTERLQWEARIDLAQAVRHDYRFDLPAGQPYLVIFDHATNTLRAESAPRGGAAATDMTGCVVERPAFAWRVDPPEVYIPGTSCVHEFHLNPIDATILACPPTGTCYTDGVNFEFVNFGFYAIFCMSPGVALLNWDFDGPQQSVNCVTFLFGSNAATWHFWDSMCGGIGVGPTACWSNFE